MAVVRRAGKHELGGSERFSPSLTLPSIPRARHSAPAYTAVLGNSLQMSEADPAIKTTKWPDEVEALCQGYRLAFGQGSEANCAFGCATLGTTLALQ
jgi:hypothetical protein